MGKRDGGRGTRLDISEGEGDPRHHLPRHENGRPKVLTPARKARGDVVAYEGEGGKRMYRSLAVPLNWYVAHRNIDEAEYEAGQRLHALWRGSILHARFATMRLGDVGGGPFEFEGAALIPRDYFRAMDAVRGFHPKRLVRQVCCFEELAGSGGIHWLRSGLADLAGHFHIDVRK